MTLPAFRLHRPRSVAEALALLAEHAPRAQVIAGGTDLVPSLRQGLFSPAHLIDLRGLAELRGISSQPDGSLHLGALTTLTEIERSPLVRELYPVLHEAAATVASPVLRNMGTLGGNICLDTRCLWYNQSLPWRRSCGFCIKKGSDGAGSSDLLCHVAPGGRRCWAAFSADTPPALLALDTEIEIAMASGMRRLSLADFYTGDGEARMKLAAGELVTRVILPGASARWRGRYRKLRIRGSIDYPLAGVAVALKFADATSNDQRRITAARVALTAVNPAPLLVAGAEAALTDSDWGEASIAVVADLAASTAKPLTTSALTPEYRREMIRVFVRRALLEAAA